MRELEENRLLGELYANLRGRKSKKRSDWIRIARLLRQVVDHYGSNDAAAEKLPIGAPMIRSIVKILELPPDVREMIRQGTILQDAAQRLAGIRGAEAQRRVARAINGMSSHDARQLIQYAKQVPGGDLEAFKQRIADSKSKKVNLHAVILAIEDARFREIRSVAARDGRTVQEWILGVVSRKLDQEAGSDS